MRTRAVLAGWRRLGACMAVALLALLTFAPALDSVICEGDSIAAASSHDAATPAHKAQTAKANRSTAQAAPNRPPARGDVGDVCPHGHCHHFSAFVLGEPVRPFVTAHVEVRAMGLRQRAPPSLPGATPERPPRA